MVFCTSKAFLLNVQLKMTKDASNYLVYFCRFEYLFGLYSSIFINHLLFYTLKRRLLNFNSKYSNSCTAIIVKMHICAYVVSALIINLNLVFYSVVDHSLIICDG